VGYTSGIFGKWHLGYLKKFNPLHHGFDRFRGYVSGNIDYISHYDRMGVHDWWEGLEHVREEGYSTHLITKHSVKFIEDNKHRPFCLYVAHEAVHAPNQAPDDPSQCGPRKGRTKGRTRSVKETYQLMMKAMDDGIGEIMATVERLGLAESTLIFFFSDNGGTGRGSNAPLRGGKGSVWEGGHRVPGIVRWPGKIKPARVSNDLCISLDLMPTMLELAGVAVPEGYKLDGISLTAHLLESRSLGPRRLFWNGVAMRDGHWKLLTKERAFEGPGLFNLAEDIGEKNNLADRYPGRLKRMTAAIGAWKKDVASGAATQPALQPGEQSVTL
jgi:arylsulfatase A-like enzyme